MTNSAHATYIQPPAALITRATSSSARRSGVTDVAPPGARPSNGMAAHLAAYLTPVIGAITSL